MLNFLRMPLKVLTRLQRKKNAAYGQDVEASPPGKNFHEEIKKIEKKTQGTTSPKRQSPSLAYNLETAADRNKVVIVKYDRKSKTTVIFEEDIKWY